MTVYVQVKSKKELNKRLADGQTVVGTQHFMGSEVAWPLSEIMPDGTVIKCFTKVVDGSPWAKSYGRWDAKNRRVL